MRVAPGVLQIGLGPGHKEGPGSLEPEEPFEVEVAAVDHIIGPRHRAEQIEGLDVVKLPGRDGEELRDVPAQVEQRVELDGPLGLPEVGPREERQTEIDRRGVERVHRRGQLHAEGLGGIEWPGDPDEDLGEVGQDSPVAPLVRIGQRAPGHAPPDAHVIEPGLHRAETRLDVAQALAVCQLGEGQAEELIETREAADLVLALVAGYAAPELGQGQEVHQLRENHASGMHGPLLR